MGSQYMHMGRPSPIFTPTDNTEMAQSHPTSLHMLHRPQCMTEAPLVSLLRDTTISTSAQRYDLLTENKPVS